MIGALLLGFDENVSCELLHNVTFPLIIPEKNDSPAKALKFGRIVISTDGRNLSWIPRIRSG